MLCISRKESDYIHIGDNIVVKIRRVQGKTVSIGIEAPKDVVIRRGELKDKREKGAA